MLPIVPLDGWVVGEPQLKFAESGKAVVRLRVKSADRRKNPETDKWEDSEILWVTVTAFGRLAENAAESLVDGDQVVAIGKWSTAEWTDQEGNKRSAPRFIAQAIGAGLALTPRRHSEATMAKHRPAQAPAGPQAGAEHVYGATYADAAVAAAPVQGGGAANPDDPWA